MCRATLALAAFNYPDFTSHDNLTHGPRRVPITSTHAVRLTDARLHDGRRCLVRVDKQLGQHAAFDTTFLFKLTGQGGLGNGADGLAFVLQNSGPTALAGKGSAGGWGVGDSHTHHNKPGIPRAIAVFFDTFRNDEDHDPSDNYIGIFNNGGPRDMRWPPHRLAYTRHLRVALKDGNAHTARILYRPPLLSVFLDDPSTPVLVSSVAIPLVADPAGSAWVGLTASTGSGYENHDLLSWSFNGTDVSSAMVTSSISFVMENCAPGHNLCTPERAIVEETQPGRYHVVLPANVEWGASIPNPSHRDVVVDNARGTVCWDLLARGAEGCSGPDGSPGRFPARSTRTSPQAR